MATHTTDSTQTASVENTASANTTLTKNHSFGNTSLHEVQGLNQQVTKPVDLPNLSFDSGPWSQPVLEKAGGLAGILGFKHMEDLGTAVEKRTIAGLSPEDRKEYDKETKANERWMEGDYRATPPSMPEHEKVAALVKQQEKEVEQKILSSMSPEEQQKYKQDKQQYTKASADAFAHNKDQPELPASVVAFNAACAKEIGGVQSMDSGPITEPSIAQMRAERHIELDGLPSKRIEVPSVSDMKSQHDPMLDAHPLPKAIQAPSISGMHQGGKIWLDFKIADPYRLYA